MLWDEQLNQEMAKAMLAEGVLVIPLRFFIIIIISTIHTHQNKDERQTMLPTIFQQLPSGG